MPTYNQVRETSVYFSIEPYVRRFGCEGNVVTNLIFFFAGFVIE